MEQILLLIFLTFSHGLGEDPVQFLVDGPEISYTSRTKNILLDVHIFIDLTKDAGNLLLTEADNIVAFWSGYPAFQSTAEVKINYLSLIEPTITNLIYCATLLDKILVFTAQEQAVKYETSCNYTYNLITISSMRTQLRALLSSKSKLVTTWTMAEITEDLAKDTALRTFATMLNEITEEWYNDLQTLVNVLESLASKIVPEEIIGNYQLSPCIGTLHEEKISVSSCIKTVNGYVCQLSVQLPVISKRVKHLIPVHYLGIKLTGENNNELFVQSAEHTLSLLNCDRYDFEAEQIPLCELKELNTQCKLALISKNIDATISHCNFSQHDPEPAVRTNNYGILIQQGPEPDTIIRRQVGDDYHLVSISLPALLYSPTTLLVSKDLKEYALAPINKSIPYRTVSSALTEIQRKNLQTRLYWLEFFATLTDDDYVQFLILTLQAILYPVAFIGVILSIKLRRQLAAASSENKPIRKAVYKSNKVALKRLLPQ